MRGYKEKRSILLCDELTDERETLVGRRSDRKADEHDKIDLLELVPCGNAFIEIGSLALDERRELQRGITLKILTNEPNVAAWCAGKQHDMKLVFQDLHVR